jgi:hypothetical protein
VTQDHDLATPDWIENEHYRTATVRYYRDAAVAVQTALRKIKNADPSLRLYEKQGEEAFMKAQLEHARRVYKLESVQRELWLLAEYVEPLNYYTTGKRMQDAT